MKNEFLILETRHVTHPVTHRRSTFVEGERTTWTQLKRAGLNRVPAWTKELAAIEVHAIRNNVTINDFNAHPTFEPTAVEAAQIELITEHLLSLGLARSEFAFCKGDSDCFKGASKDVLWIGVKMANANDVFLRDTGRPVTLNRNNFISAATFIRRVENDGPLFVKNV